MDHEEYQQNYFIQPPPRSHYRFSGRFYSTLYYEDYEAAVAFYSQVLGIPAYQEGEGTRGWQIGSGWLTLLRGRSGNPKNMELMIEVESVEEAENLHGSLLRAGASGAAPVDQVMYGPVRYCQATDPFGVELVIFCQRQG